MGTDFNIIYKRFYSKITDDMYMELDKVETDALLYELLINAIPWFEFPRINLNDYSDKHFNVVLTNEEINILATYMVLGWIDQQLASIEVTRMKYSGSDFKFTSQANHMSKLTSLRKEYERIGLHLQRLYKRRKIDKNGQIRSTFGSIMSGKPAISLESRVPSPNDPEDGPGGGSDEWEDMEDIIIPEDQPGQDEWEDMENLSGGSSSKNDNWESM